MTVFADAGLSGHGLHTNTEKHHAMNLDEARRTVQNTAAVAQRARELSH